MPKVIFKDHSGSELETVEVDSGSSLMQAAIDNGIDGITAECGGACSCATCHCYIGEPWIGKTSAPSDMEKELLLCVVDPKGNSRLACQVNVTDELNGVEVIIPESQY